MLLLTQLMWPAHYIMPLLVFTAIVQLNTYRAGIVYDAHHLLRLRAGSHILRSCVLILSWMLSELGLSEIVSDVVSYDEALHLNE